MKKQVFIPILFLLLLICPVAAHVPMLPPEKSGVENAIFIEDPHKSWAIYGELKDNEADYYAFDLEQGDRLKLSLFSTRPDFSGRLALMSPEIQSSGSVPGYVEHPSGYNVSVIQQIKPLQAEYEPFSPTSYYYFAHFDTTVERPGTYYLAVFSPVEEHYGLVVGYRENYNLFEWVRVPLDMVSVRVWEGQSILMVLAPVLGTVVVGGAVLSRDLNSIGSPKGIWGWLGGVGGLLIMGSGLLTLFQMTVALTRAPIVSEVVLTMFFIFVSIVLGAILVRISLKDHFTLNDRFLMVVLAIFSLLAWSGFYIGPALVAAVALAGKS